MIGIIVVGHGHFATGISSAVRLILGEQKDFLAVDFPEGDTKTELEKNIGNALDAMRDMEHILVFCDLLSGSPFNTMVPEAMKDDRIRVFYGTNLGMLMETVMNRNIGGTWEELVAGCVENGREQIGIFTAEESGKPEEDDWE